MQLKMSRFTLLLTLVCTAVISQAQSYIFNYQVPVEQYGTTLQNPFAGGLNNPQFSKIDMNADGKEDLFIFDRTGGCSMILLNEGNPGETDYTYWYQYAARFPQMEDWAILIDYNCDALPDIITGFNTGIRTYIAERTGDNVTYTLDVDKLQFTEAGFFFDLPVGNIDIPGFADVDFDGDIDVLSFNMSGGIVDHYTNRAVENGDPCGTWALERINGCWGNFYESGIAYSVQLDYTCKGGRTSDGVHAGSTFMLFDEDADDDMDVVLGDLAFNVLNKLTNGGDKNDAHIVDQDTTFPSYDLSYDLPIYPAPFLVDVDNDNKKDMLVAPNNVNESETRKNVWYYKNVSDDDTYVFDFQTDSLIVSTMIDVGDGAYPVFFDYNYDGLQDIIIGNYGYLSDGDELGMLALFENTGTATQPAYTLVTTDLDGVSAFGFVNLAPTFGDLDNDGDKDMLLGESEGFMHFFKNIGPPDGPAEFILFTPFYQGLDPGKDVTPQLVDIDGDGLIDLITGEQNGNLNYYHNTGTAAAPIFTLENEFWGSVDVRAPEVLTGFSSPFFDTASNTLYVGCQEGTIYQFTPSADFTGAFTEVTSAFSDIDAGGYSVPFFADINTDGLKELMLGNKRGGIMLFRDALSTDLATIDENTLMIYPNPAGDKITVQHQQLTDVNSYTVHIVDINGSIISAQTAQANSGSLQIQTENIPSGYYILEIIEPSTNANWHASFIRL